ANWPAASAKFAASAPLASAQLAAVSQFYRQILGSSLNRAALTDFRVSAERRFAAVSLAARLYALDHAGRYPPSLNALVPDYLPALPADPFAADGRAVGYLIAENGKRPIVYSVDENGRDDTNAKTVFSAAPM